MTNKRCFGVIFSCLFLLGPAAGADATEGIQAGPALLYPALSVDTAYDDNLYLVSHDPENGWVTTVSPSLTMSLPVRRFYLNAEGGLDFLSYSGVDEENSTDWHAGAAVGADFPGGLSFKIADKYESRYLIGSQEYGAGEDSTVNTLSATLAYAIRSALKLELSGSQATTTYDLSVRRERVETQVQADLYWKFRPAMSGILEGSFVKYDYDSNTAQDNSAAQVAVGLDWEVTAKSTGVAKAGMQWKQYDTNDASRGTEDDSYYTLSAGLKHAFTERTTFKVDLSRASQESDFSENPYYLRTMITASLTQTLTSKLFFRFGARYSYEEYPNSTTYDNPYDEETGSHTGERTDKSFAGTATLGFDVTRWLSLEAEYGIGSRDSTFDTFDYDVNRVSLSAKAAF